MDSAGFAARIRLQSIQLEYRLILQELRHTSPTDYQRYAQLRSWASACVAEYLAVLQEWPGRTASVDSV
jgi:hypothetical protein